MSDEIHRFEAAAEWSGSTAAGPDAFPRRHSVSIPPGGTRIEASTSPAFGGDPHLLNPEQMLVAATLSCHLLAFLTICANSRIDALAYGGEAVGEMPAGLRPLRVTRIVVRPRITVAAGTDLARVRRIVDMAHRACIVSNSLTSEVVVEPEIIEARATGG
jgi:organic hydroperoxide reductase OsmC/OhrA